MSRLTRRKLRGMQCVTVPHSMDQPKSEDRHVQGVFQNSNSLRTENREPKQKKVQEWTTSRKIWPALDQNYHLPCQGANFYWESANVCAWHLYLCCYDRRTECGMEQHTDARESQKTSLPNLNFSSRSDASGSIEQTLCKLTSHPSFYG